MALRLRGLTEEEQKTIDHLIHARSTPVGKLKRAQIIWLASHPRVAQRDKLRKSSARETSMKPVSKRRWKNVLVIE